MKVGYVRTSSEDKISSVELSILKRSGCEFVYAGQSEKNSIVHQYCFIQILNNLRRGDTLVVSRLDKIAHSLPDLVQAINYLEKRGIHFQSLAEGIDTSSTGGRLILHIMAAITDFEQNLNCRRFRAESQVRSLMGAKPGSRKAAAARMFNTTRNRQ